MSFKPSEYQLLKSLSKGDTKAFNLVFDLYYQVIYNFCIRFLKQSTLAEEATADVFITLWMRRDIINPSIGIKRFLYKVAKDTAYDYLKKVASNNQLKTRFLEKFSKRDNEYSIEYEYIEKERYVALESVINDLPPKRQTVFKLRYFEGMDNRTIAKQLNISPNTVKVHLVKARQYLREHTDIPTALSRSYIGLILLLGL